MFVDVIVKSLRFKITLQRLRFLQSYHSSTSLLDSSAYLSKNTGISIGKPMNKIAISILLYSCFINAIAAQRWYAQIHAGPNLHFANLESNHYNTMRTNPNINYQAAISLNYEYKKFGIEFGFLKRRQNLRFSSYNNPNNCNCEEIKVGEINQPYYVTAFPLLFSYKLGLNEKMQLKVLLGTLVGVRISERIFGETNFTDFINNGDFTYSVGSQSSTTQYEFDPLQIRQSDEYDFMDPTMVMGFEWQYEFQPRWYFLLRTTGTWSTFPLISGTLEIGENNNPKHGLYIWASDHGQNMTLDLGIQYQIFGPNKKKTSRTRR